MSKIVTSRVVYNINYKNKIEKMKKLSTIFSSLSNISIYPEISLKPFALHQDPGKSRLRREDPETGVRYYYRALLPVLCLMEKGLDRRPCPHQHVPFVTISLQDMQRNG